MKNLWIPLCLAWGLICGLLMPDPITAILTCVLGCFVIIYIWFEAFGREK